LRYGLSYRDVEELLAERGITVDHVTIYRWVQTFTAEFIDAARAARHSTGDRWFVDETYVKVTGRWTHLYRAVDQHGQGIDVLVSIRRDAAAARVARAFFARALRCGPTPVEVVTDRAPAYPRVIDEAAPTALHLTERYANNPIEADHGRFKARLRPMRGLQRLASARTIAAGHAFVQNLRCGHYAITADLPVHDRVRVAFDDLARTSDEAQRQTTPDLARPVRNNATAPGQVLVVAGSTVERMRTWSVVATAQQPERAHLADQTTRQPNTSLPVVANQPRRPALKPSRPRRTVAPVTVPAPRLIPSPGSTGSELTSETKAR
jgi:transposase-like protein